MNAEAVTTYRVGMAFSRRLLKVGYENMVWLGESSLLLRIPLQRPSIIFWIYVWGIC